MMESWMPIDGYETVYEVSNLGNVRSVERVARWRNKCGNLSTYLLPSKKLKKQVQHNGYETVDLCANGTHKRFLVHRLVAQCFLEKPEGKDCINHKDCDKTNNRADNLEWCTQSENIQYAYDIGTKTPPHMKRVGQYNMAGQLIAMYDSTADANRATGVASQNIQKVCWGKRNMAGGFQWRYIEQS